MQLSIVTTLYESAATVREFHRRMSEAARALTDDYEIVMVDDGSPDESLKVALELVETDPRLSVIELSRNFGHHKAIMTGLRAAEGTLVFLIDVDLEEPPEVLHEFNETLRARDVDVVYGVQKRRKGGAFERLTGAFAYALFRLLIPIRIPRNHITVRLMRREYVTALTSHGERQMVIGGLWVITGFKQVAVPVDKGHRGATSYRPLKKLHALIESITSFSEMPLLIVFYLGICIMLISGVMGGWLVWQKAGGVVMSGWVSTMVSIWFLGGLTVFSVGVVGLYVSRIFIETKQRPYTIIRRMHGRAARQAETTRGQSRRTP